MTFGKLVVLTMIGLLVAVAAIVFVPRLFGGGLYAIKGNSYLNNSIYSTENHANNSVVVWATASITDAYCTFDPTLVAKVNTIVQSQDTRVLIEYRSVNNNDPEYNAAGLGDGCSSESSANIYKLVNIWTWAELKDRVPVAVK